jgi:anti-sigma regulatory factor (Ser/Thr protein kinase)
VARRLTPVKGACPSYEPLTLRESYQATPDSIPRARHDVRRLASSAGASRALRDAMSLAVTEAVTNSIVHGYRGKPGEVELTAQIAPGTLVVIVTDRGCGFHTPPANPGLGVGLALMADASAHLDIAECATGGTDVTCASRSTLRRKVRTQPGACSSASRESSPQSLDRVMTMA